MMDLIYDADAAAAVKARFPEAKIDDASDEVHESRISVEVNATKDEYMRWAVIEGIGAVSMAVQLMLHSRDKEELAKLRGWLEERKALLANGQLKPHG